MILLPVFAATRSYAIWHCDRRVFFLVLAFGLIPSIGTTVRTIPLSTRSSSTSAYTMYVIVRHSQDGTTRVHIRPIGHVRTVQRHQLVYVHGRHL